ncbi:MAG TPA: DNA-directed RNA polymerase subunit alpha [candidate division Zixibacteria bacterium]|nr:DNA-directed RNA polymerase subunit alpha [candidate division Zixibacteria bacterium]
MKWKNLDLPNEVVKEPIADSANLSRFIVEPLERGYGTTLGNSLRRVLLSSIQGAAPVSVRVTGVLHEFGTVDGVYEDVTNIILNVKKMRIRYHTDEMRTISIKRTAKGKVTAGMFECGSDVELLNPELHIVELTTDREFEMEIDIAPGRGYAVADQNRRDGAPANTIFVDALFSPVVRTWFNVENTRVGQRTDYDRLMISIETDGSITPEDALCHSAKLLKDHLQLFIHLDEEIELREDNDNAEESSPLRKLLDTRVDDLELSVRSSNCLRAANIATLEELVSKTESEMLKFRNFGRKSLNELNAILEELGLHFGMNLDQLRESGQI